MSEGPLQPELPLGSATRETSPVASPGPTAEQLAVISSWGQGIAVMAGAGSGKTFTLVEKVRALLQNAPEARFAAVSFTEKSASDLRAKLTRLTLKLQGRPLHGHVVTTIHGLCSSIIREYPREAGFDGDETMLSESEATGLWRRALDALFFDELPPEVEAAFSALADRESRASLYDLLRRVRDLQANDVLEKIENSPELRRLSSFVLERYDRLKRRRGALDFNDLELGAARALEAPAVSADYRARFDLVMVDEFQDTNPVQARILAHLCRPGYANLCVVGDPKQSIYRFRDADVTVFEEFCSRMPVRAALTKNFRSVPGILEFCNEVCAPAFVASGMEFQPLAAGLPAKDGIEPVVSADIRSPEDLARLIRAEVDRGMPLSDMALLLRAIRGGSEKWLKALTAAGIPLAIESGGLLWNDPRARELAHFLKWWSNPANEIAGIAFLRAPWIGISERTIEEWRTAVAIEARFGTTLGEAQTKSETLAPGAAAAPPLQDRTRTARPGSAGMLHAFLRANHPVARILRPYRVSPGRVRPGALLLSLLEIPEIERDLGVLVLALWHRCEELSEEGLDFHRVAARIAEACDESRREKAVPPPKNAGQLRVMTIHGSKGLEFPQVILLDFPEKKSRNSTAPLLYWDRHEGAYLAGRDEDGKRLTKDPRENERKSSEAAKELAESKRVLYVALTRARDRLLLALPTTEDPLKREAIARHREKIADVTEVDFWRGWIEAAIARRPKVAIPSTGLSGGAAADAETPVPSMQNAPEFLPIRPRHSVSEWNLLSRCERAYEWTVIRPLAPTEEEEWQELIATETLAQARREQAREDGTRRPKLAQSEIGTRVHKALELGDAGGLRELESILGASVFRADPVIEWMETSPWMVSGTKAWRELAFEVPIQSASSSREPQDTSSSRERLVGRPAAPRAAPATLIGALDRLVRLDEGTYAILDFKVTGRKKSAEALLETYRNQLNLYAWALESLVPDARGKTRALLVHIAEGQVQEIEVPLEANRLDEFRRRAEILLRGKAGAPSPSSLCEVCEHRERCPEGSEFVDRQNDGERKSGRGSLRRLD